MFKVQCFSDEDIKATYRANEEIDAAGYPFNVGTVGRNRSQTLLQTILMLTGACDAKCRKARHPLSGDEIHEILKQTRALGSRLVYIPGEGEPMLDDALWQTLEAADQYGMSVVLFTNGLLLSNDIAAQRRWRLSSEEIVRRLAGFPVYIYHKLWSLNPSRFAGMLGGKGPRAWMDIARARRVWRVPRGLALLREIFSSRLASR
jgi:hypothetical protein